MSPPRVVYLTGGTVGAGHLMRGLALRRALERRGVRDPLEIWSPALPFPEAASIASRPVVLEPELLLSAESAPQSALGQALLAAKCDLLIVDLFWAPVHHLLPRLGFPAWLLVRQCPAAWFAGPTGVRFDTARFQRIIAIEPLAHGPATHRVDPVVVCNRDELRPRGDLRALLGVPDSEPVRVAVQAGLPGEAEALAMPGYRTLDLHQPGAPLPLAPWLDGADAIRSGAGYNAFWESRWLGTHARTTFVPFPRRIDDQAWRVRIGAEVTPQANGADQLAAWMLEG